MFRVTETPQGGRVMLAGKEVINLAANNYLGLANAPELVAAAKASLDEFGVGPCASRNIVGEFPAHACLEEALARFKGAEAALVFSSGYAANVGAIPVLVGRGDVILSDELNHGSLIDGCRLSRAEIRVFAHADAVDLEQKLAAAKADLGIECSLRDGMPVSPDGKPLARGEGRMIVITDAVFSMDGDVAPLAEIADICERYGAMLLVDDAHGDGVMGSHGRGSVDHFGIEGRVTLEVGSLGKAFGTMGGFVAGSQALIDEIRTGARSFILTASPLAPSIAAAATAAIELLERDDSRVRTLWENRERFAKGLTEAGFDTGISTTPVVPVMIGDEDLAARFSDALYERGVFAQAIKFPLVPRGKARIRCILSADHTPADIDEALVAILETGREFGII